MSWASQRYGAPAAPEEEKQSGPSGWATKRFGAVQQPESTGVDVPGVPYPVAPADVFGLPEGSEPSLITRMAEGVGELASVAMGPEGGPTSSEEQRAAFDARKRQLGQDLVAGAESNLATRALGRSGVAVGNFVQNVPLRGLQALGVKGAGETADESNRFLEEMQKQDSVRNEEGWTAKTFGPSVARGADSIVQSIGEGVLSGMVGKAAGGAKAAQKAMMLYFGASGADKALTEAEDFRYEDGSAMTTKQKLGYAAGMGAFESLLMLAGGKLAAKMGLETAEEALFRELRPAVMNLLSRTGVKEAVRQVGRGSAGAAIESGEEAATALAQGVWKAVFQGDEDGVVDDVKQVLTPGNQKSIWGDVGFAAATGGAARGSIGVANQLSHGVEAAIRQLPSVVQNVGERAAKAKVAETPASVEAPVEAPTPATQATSVPAEPAAAVPAEVPGEPVVASPAEATPPAPVEPPVDGPRVPPSDVEAAAEPPGESPVQIKNERMKQLAREFGRSETLYSPERQSFRQWANVAIEANIPAKAVEIATSIKAEPRPLSKVEVAGLNVRLLELRANRRKVRSQLVLADQAGDPSAKAIAQHKLEEISREFDVIHDATRLAGTEQGQAFVARRLNLDDDMEFDSLTGRWRAVKQGQLTDAEIAEAESAAQEFEALDAEVVKKQADQNREIASEALAAMKNSKTTLDSVEGLNGRLKALLEANCDLE